ncbi:MAG TPA: TetR-like C-terminal domain-containing protein [Solirubrobacteraceae bacterium]|nr:TetR-like C-terminal domain-containing protein [Solirubrobacteraceae bacterium]
MPRVGLDAEAVVAAAAELADAEGLHELTLARLAERLGVRSPSLYAHVGGLADLRTRLAARGARELTAALQAAAAGRARADALHAVADAYRAYAHAHPGTYAATQRAPGTEPDAASGEFATAAADLVGVLVAVLRGYELHDDDAIHGVRMVRAALHGFVSLEREGGFAMPIDLKESYRRLVQTLDHGLGSR